MNFNINIMIADSLNFSSVVNKSIERSFKKETQPVEQTVEST
jgi:hypothetical protein